MTSKDYSIAQLKAVVRDLSENELETFFEGETRTGALKIKWQQIKLYEKQHQCIEKYEKMLTYEKRYAGRIVAGVDEVGRGPLAGPVVACAVILDASHAYYGLNDSKQMSKHHRVKIEADLLKGVTYAIGVATVEEIDTFNIYEATKMAMHRAINDLPVTPDVLLIDALTLNTGLIEEAIIKGDATSISIAAASVIAKEYRDRMMSDYAKTYPYYDFENNAGYGTPKHLEGLKNKGITPIHRKSFEPIKSMCNNK
ncbi:ribonuclease HII [Macrococcoides caseolyticum]|uniref:ribonuclease HII n=1 Tax=Macrococcoides caseolyticum TaxID=69966 RepID=UPI001F22BA55|nr:ribonuclease HII [Macrococcus caseolyticus]MCE4956762.1 ribonuclease HII [Macrococcus caseolyticus]